MHLKVILSENEAGKVFVSASVLLLRIVTNQD